ncbi:MAG: DUF4105 domain-containing protein [Cyclobacteriaceae bacterium]|nr:DUF4105 domain-containing protein [Cyclobacteriaceae bacterium]MCH8515395.1 DUF4105 domain-containing protein [Cyclobacteriaceae bacterium]
MRKLFIPIFSILFIITSISTFLKAADVKVPFGEQATVSLITITPGEELYSSFGHSVFWFHDPQTGFDRTYSFGTFDFDEPNFYIKFTRGKLNYRLSKSGIGYEVAVGRAENRSVIRQVLNLEHNEIIRLYERLEENYLPENRYYLYDFFFDNCSTRLRDLLEELLGDQLVFHNFDEEGQFSFRELIDLYTEHQPWADFGMDLGLGLPADKIASPRETLFLPDFLYVAFDSATIKRGDERLPLVRDVQVLFEADPDKSAPTITPFYLFWILFLTIGLISILNRDKPHIMMAFDRVYFGILGFIGILLLLLWTATDHSVTAYNLDLLWALPTHLVIIFFLKRNSKHERLVTYYFAVSTILGITLLLLWTVIPQDFNNDFIPIILITIVRSRAIWRKWNRGHTLSAKELNATDESID